LISNGGHLAHFSECVLILLKESSDFDSAVRARQFVILTASVLVEWSGECVRQIALFGLAFLAPRHAIPQFNP
jgi:hypothetical protein